MYDKKQEQEPIEKANDYKSSDYDSGMSFPEDQVKYPTEIDSQLIKSGYTKNEFKVKIPQFEEVSFGIPFKDKNGKIRLVNGKPVLKTIKTLKYFVGYEEKTFPLPVDLHNNTVTSSILEPQELSLIRMIDDFCYDLSLETVSNPDTDYSTSIQRFAGTKASIVESSKGKFGRMAELAKTTISKGEQHSWDYNQSRELEEFNARKNKRGWFGLGIGPF